MSLIFVSYRHEDTAPTVGRLCDHLRDQFGARNLFRDVDSRRPGKNLTQVITDAIGQCVVMLVVIGPHWLNAHDANGQRRLDDPDDMVRYEIETAFAMGKQVIPILVDGTVMPPAADLPASIRQLGKCQAISLRNDHQFATDIKEVITALEHYTDQIDAEARSAIYPTGVPIPLTLIGRNEELDELLTYLRAGRSNNICALHGLGGIGKTAIAAMAVAQMKEEPATFPGGVAWIDCLDLSGEQGLAELWKRISSAINLHHLPEGDVAEVHPRAVAEHLAQMSRVLIVLDNVEARLDVEVVLNTLNIPGHTTLLLTSRHAIVPDRLVSIRLNPLAHRDSVSLLYQRLQQFDRARPWPDEMSDINAIAGLLGGLPLAIELVAAYAGMQRMRLGGVLRELKDDGVEAIPLNFDTHHALRSRFDRSWEVLESQERLLFASLSLIHGASILRAAAVALAYAVVGARDVEDESKKRVARYEARRTIVRLIRYALIEPLAEEDSAQQRLRLHPLLRQYAADRLGELDAGMVETLHLALRAFWQDYGRHHASFDGLDPLEAEAVWQAHDAEQREAILRGDTTNDLLTPQAHRQRLRELGYYMGIHGEQVGGRKYLLESLSQCLSMRDYAGAADAHRCLAALDEDDGHVTEARAHYLEAAEYFERAQSHQAEAEAMRARVNMLSDG